jgi:ABC-type glycerol-3-phosphate transport system substrate-binding protein
MIHHVGRLAVSKWTVLLCLLLVLTASSGVVAAEKVTFMGVFLNWGPELEQALANFTARTGIEVELLQGTGWPDMMQKVKTMAAGGIPPDVIYGDNVRIMELAELGLLTALDQTAASKGVNLANYPGVVLDGLRIKGQLYSLPTAVSIYASFYNVDLFDKAGVGSLPTNWASNSLNWDEWVALAKKLTVDANGDGVVDQFGLAGFGYQGGFNMIGMWNATDVTPDRTKYLGTDPSVIRALEFTTKLWTEYGVVGGAFLTGTAAIFPAQPVQLNTLLTQARAGNKLNWSLGILPKGDVRAAQTGFHSLGLSVDSKNSAAAFELIRYLAYDREGAVLFTRAENRVPVLPETGRDYIQRWNTEFPSGNAQVLVDAIPYLWDWRVISGKGGSEILTLQTEAFNYIRLGQKSVKDAVEFIAPRVQTALQQ